MAIGVFELENWLKDAAIQGLAGLQQQDDSYFENIAGRMVDLRLSNIARRIRGMIVQKYSADWLPYFSKEIAELFLFVRQFKQYHSLSESQKMGWLQQAGISLKKKDVLALQDPISDYWIVLGQREGEDDRLRWRQTWLWGEGYQDAALILDFAWGGNPFEGAYKVGVALQADLCFYPSPLPQRALLKDVLLKDRPFARLEGQDSISAFTLQYTRALAEAPGVRQIAGLLQEVIPFYQDGVFQCCDQDGYYLTLKVEKTSGWQLVATSAGQGIMLFGLFDGESFEPYSAVANQRIIEIKI